MTDKTVWGSTTTLPSGIEVYFQEKPKRLYRVNGEEVVSVTQALDILHKPALIWWGQSTGVEGMLSLLQRGQIVTRPWEHEAGAKGFDIYAQEPAGEQRVWKFATKETVTALLTEHKLTVNHVRDAAGVRGQSVHDALQDWVENGTIPVPELYPEEEKGYISALIAFLTDLGPVTKAETEVMVASAEHGYAGRTDVLCTHKACKLVTKKETPAGRKPAVYTDFPGGRVMFDCKTSKDIFITQFIQLEAYELALPESGYKPTKRRMIVNVNADGKYEVGVSRASSDHFLAVLSLYHALEDLKNTPKGGTDDGGLTESAEELGLSSEPAPGGADDLAGDDEGADPDDGTRAEIGPDSGD